MIIDQEWQDTIRRTLQVSDDPVEGVDELSLARRAIEQGTLRAASGAGLRMAFFGVIIAALAIAGAWAGAHAEDQLQADAILMWGVPWSQ